MRCSGWTVTGSVIIPLSDFFTFSTSRAWASTGMLRWTKPMPPSCAIEIAICDSVTVSIAAETNGMLSSIRRDRRVAMLASRGMISLSAGTKSTSSKVRASSSSRGSMGASRNTKAPARVTACGAWSTVASGVVNFHVPS